METSLKNLYVDLGGGLKGQKGWQESNTTNPISGKYASQKVTTLVPCEGAWHGRKSQVPKKIETIYNNYHGLP